MPSRTREHILEDESRLALIAALGGEFVFRPERPDYGIDGEVEFMPGGDPSGMRFKVQLKATDQEDLPKALVVPLKTDRIRQYIAQHLPVLMIRYHASSKDLFARWFHEARFDPRIHAQRSASFRWAESDRWTPDTPEALVDQARANLALRSAQFELPIDATLGGEDPRLTYREFQLVRRAASAVGDVVQLVEEPRSTVSAAFFFAHGELAAAVAKTAHVAMDVPEDYPGPSEPEVFASDCLTLLAIALATAGHANLAGRISRQALATSSLASNWDAVTILAAAMVQARQVRESLELADALGDLETAPDGPSVIFTFVGMALSKRLTNEENTAVRTTLQRRHARTLERHGSVAAARTAMNLGNHHRTRAEPELALPWYESARELDPGYANLPHYWREIAGAQFGSHHYYESARSYAAARTLDPDPFLVALEADAHMYAGAYAAAQLLWEEYAAADDSPGSAEFRLKLQLVGVIVDQLGISQQQRRQEDSVALFTCIRANSDPNSIVMLAREAIRMDALSALAWFNLAQAERTLGREPREYGLHFMAAALLYRQDAEVWAEALLSTLFANEMVSASMVLVTGQRLTDGDLMGVLGDVLAQGPFAASVVDAMLRNFDEILAAAASSDPADYQFAVRILTERGVQILGVDTPDTPRNLRRRT